MAMKKAGGLYHSNEWPAEKNGRAWEASIVEGDGGCLGHKPFGSQGKQECLRYWKQRLLLGVAVRYMAIGLLNVYDDGRPVDFSGHARGWKGQVSHCVNRCCENIDGRSWGRNSEL